MTGRFSRTASATILGATLAASTSAPFSNVHRTALAVVLLSPLALLLALLVDRLDLEVAAVSTLVGAAAFLEACAVYAANLLFVDAPDGAYTVAGYVIGSLGAAGLVLALHRLLQRARRRSPAHHRAVLGALLFAGGVSCGLLDAGGLEPEYTRLHSVLVLATVLCFVVAVRLGAGKIRWAGLLPAPLVVAILFGVPGRATWRQIAQGRTIDSHMLRLGQQLVGVARVGASEHARPGVSPPAHAATAPVVRPDAPRIILLLTIDAFRCGFDRGDRPELFDACPAITRLAREGRVRFDHYSNAPTTTPSLTALLGGSASPLPERLRELGYRSAAIVTHPNTVGDPSLRASFDELDQSLTAASLTTHATAQAVSERVIDRLLADDGSRQFIWAHYFDAHFPYVSDPAAPSPFKDQSVAAYAAAVRRTDAAIGRLCAVIRRSMWRDQVMVVLTADHGEEFGEHGDYFHGASLHEVAVRVPLIVWSPAGRSFGASILPVSHDRTAGYLLNAVTGRPYSTDGPVVISSDLERDPQRAVIADGWKLIVHPTLGYNELYHLRVDPEERQELSDDPREVL